MKMFGKKEMKLRTLVKELIDEKKVPDKKELKLINRNINLSVFDIEPMPESNWIKIITENMGPVTTSPENEELVKEVDRVSTLLLEMSNELFAGYEYFATVLYYAGLTEDIYVLDVYEDWEEWF